jgi:hypothetical protein
VEKIVIPHVAENGCNPTKLLWLFLYSHHIKEHYLKWDMIFMQVMGRFGGAEVHILYAKLRLFSLR